MGSNELFYSDFYKPALELFNAHSALQIDVRALQYPGSASLIHKTSFSSHQFNIDHLCARGNCHEKLNPRVDCHWLSRTNDPDR